MCARFAEGGVSLRALVAEWEGCAGAPAGDPEPAGGGQQAAIVRGRASASCLRGRAVERRGPRRLLATLVEVRSRVRALPPGRGPAKRRPHHRRRGAEPQCGFSSVQFSRSVVSDSLRPHEPEQVCYFAKLGKSERL